MLYDPKWNAKKRQKAISKIYLAAADAIQERGHCAMDLRNPDGAMCLFGALNFVINGDALRVTNKSYSLLDPLWKFTGNLHPVSWNNTEGRTKRQVVNMLRKAATVLA